MKEHEDTKRLRKAKLYVLFAHALASGRDPITMLMIAAETSKELHKLGVTDEELDQILEEINGE